MRDETGHHIRTFEFTPKGNGDPYEKSEDLIDSHCRT